MLTLRSFALPLVAALLSASPSVAQKSAASTAAPVVAESLSGLDLIPNRKTGTFGIRLNHRFSQPATLRLIDTRTSRILKTELLAPSAAPTRAVQVGRLLPGEYKMEVVLPDTVYWKTVRISK